MRTPQPLVLTGLACSVLLAAGCNRPRLSDRPESSQPPVAARPVADPMVDARLALALEPKDGSVLVIQGQPTADQLRVFAEDGGGVVVNLRTEQEMTEKVAFDERAVAERAGLRYIWMPTGGPDLDLEQVRAFGQAIEGTESPILLHCASGGRASALWTAHLVINSGLSKEAALARGKAVGLTDTMAPVAERIMLQTPDRVVASIDPANLRAAVDTLAGFGTRHTLSDTASTTRGIGAARAWVAGQFEAATANSGRSGDLTCRIEFDTHAVEADGRRITRPVEVVNVVCTIPGADPSSRDRLYYVLAHLDSRATDVNNAEIDAPGANDDGSGVAALIELARVISAERLDATVVLMATSGEEQGLYGARLHAQAAKAAGKNIRAVLNNDMIGDPTGPRLVCNEVRVFSEGLPLEMFSQDPERIATAVRQIRSLGAESEGPSRQLARYIHSIGELHRAPVRAKLILRPDRFLRGGDHTPFNETGFPAVRFTEMYDKHDRQHQDLRTDNGVAYGDVASAVDEGYLADVTRLNAAVLVHIANAPSTPTNARIIVAELTNSTTLRWDASPEPDVAGYEIVWRDTAALNWEHAQDVGTSTEGTVPRTKDNSTFGVRAYDRDGYRSPVAFPLPAQE